MTRKKQIILNTFISFFAWLALFFCLPDVAVMGADSISDNGSDTEAERVAPEEVTSVEDNAVRDPAASTGGIDPQDVLHQGEKVAEEEAGEDTFVDTWHRALSGTITGSAYWVDSFFYDERMEAEENQSRMLLRLESFSEDGQGTDVKLRASLRVGIPYAQKRLKLIVAGDPNRESDIQGTSGSTVRSSFDRIDKNDVSISLQRSIVEKFNRFISTRLGLIFRNWRPEVFVEGRYRYFYNLDPWGFRFTERLRWYTDKGWDSLTTFDFERPLSERFFFRTTVEGGWLEEEDGFSHSLNFSLSHLLSPRRAIEYSMSNSFQTRPNYHLLEVALRIRYRQRIWRDWLFYDIEPQMRFPNEYDFDMTPGIMLRLEAIIGKYKRL